MAEGPLSLDRMSRCEAASDLYSVIRSNRLPAPKNAEVSPVVDVLSEINSEETIQQKLEREALELLNAKYSKVSSKKTIFFVRTLKYLSLAALLPLYVTAYALPKWVFKKGLPAVAKKTQFMREQIAQLFHHFTKIIATKVKKIESISHQYIRKNIETVVSFFSTLKENISLRTKKLSLSISKPVNRLTNTAKRLMIASKRLVNSGKSLVNAGKRLIAESKDVIEQIKLTINRLSNFIRQPFSRVGTNIKEIISRINKKTFYNSNDSAPKALMQQIFHSFTINWIEKQQHLLSFLKAKLSETKNRTVFKKFTEFTRQFTHRVRNQVHQQINSVMTHVTSPFIPFVNIIKNQVIQLGHFFQKKTNQWSQPVKRLVGRVKELVKETSTKMTQLFGNVFSPIIHSTITPALLWIRAQVTSFRSKARKIKQTSQKAMRYLRGLSATRLRKLTNHFFGNFGRWLKSTLKELPKKTIAVVVAVAKGCVTGIRRLFQWFRSLLVWLKVLIKYSLQLLKELVKEISFWFDLT